DQLKQEIQDRNARLIDLGTYLLNGERRFSAVMVENTGDNAKSWWWYTNLDLGALKDKVEQHGARIVDSEVRSQSASGNRYSVILEKREGKSWHWYTGLNSDQVRDRYIQKGMRIVDIEPYQVDGNKRFTIAMINNSNASTTRMRKFMEGISDGSFGFHLKRVNGPVRASIRPDQTFYPASTIKVVEHMYAMRRVEISPTDLDASMLTRYTNASDSCNDTHNNSEPSVTETLRKVLTDMMVDSDNQSTNAIQEFFGNGNAGTGRNLINNFAESSTGISDDTRINHKFACGGPSNDPANTMTLRDITRLYEEIADGQVFSLNSTRDDFYQIMLNGNYLSNIVDEEAPPGVDTAAFKAGMELAHKAGNWGSNVSIAGVVTLPLESGSRQLVYALHMQDLTSEDISLWDAADELLRDEIRLALETFE
ncbi:MAG: serine hydrolase, partial [Pseudomonadota bacterium]